MTAFSLPSQYNGFRLTRRPIHSPRDANVGLTSLLVRRRVLGGGRLGAQSSALFHTAAWKMEI